MKIKKEMNEKSANVNSSFVCTIDQFQNLDLNKTRILGYYGQGSKFFDREILDGIYPKPGGAYIHSVYSHRRVLDISRQIFHVAPWVPLRQNMLVARSD